MYFIDCCHYYLFIYIFINNNERISEQIKYVNIILYGGTMYMQYNQTLLLYLHCRCWTSSSPTWPCASRSTSPMCFTPPWVQEDGNTLIYSPSWGSHLCTTLPSYGGMVSVARQRLNSKARVDYRFGIESSDTHLFTLISALWMLSVRSLLKLLTYFLGALYPTSMRINGQGRLVVNFRTEARFRGLFVSTHPGRA